MSAKRAYDRELQTLVASFGDVVPRLLLHSCCGPCSTYVLSCLAPYFEIVVFFYNPNIYPEAEYRRRLEEQRKILNLVDFPHGARLIEGAYEPARFKEAVKGVEHLGEGSERCFRCYALRLEAAAAKAKDLGCDYVASTLSVSPHKNVVKINEIGEGAVAAFGVRHLPNDFKKRGGYARSVAYSREWSIYRQDYCGCAYSLREAKERQA